MRVVTKSEAQKIASEHSMEYFETSAKDNINIQEMMLHIQDKVYDNLFSKAREDDEDYGKQSVMLSRKQQKEGKPNASSNQANDCKCWSISFSPTSSL